MAQNAPPVPAKALRAPATRVTRSASTLSKEVEPSSPADSPAKSAATEERRLGESDQDDDAEDEIILAELPSQSHDSALSSQARRQLAPAGSSALEDRDLVMDAYEDEEYSGDEDDENIYVDEEGEEDEMRDGQDDGEAQGEGDESAEEESEEEDSRSEGELQSIRYEMHGVEEAVPALAGKYKLVDRLGEGALPRALGKV